RSPNGATCARLAAAGALHVLIAAFVNARAVACAARELMSAGDRAVTIIACGERWSQSASDGALRFAVEDYLGAGAVIYHLPETRSPEAQTCARAFDAARVDLRQILLACGSGRELVGRAAIADIDAAAMLDVHQ